jgi:hypothetical protein
MAIEQLLVRLRLESGQYKTEAKQAAQATDGIAASAKNASTGWDRAAKGIGVSTTALKAGVAGAALGVAAFVKGSIQASSDLTESINAVNVQFGEAAEGVLAIGENSAEAFGLSKAAFNQFAVRFSAFANTIAGETGQSVVEVVEEMTTRIADFASVHNLSLEEAATVAQSTLAGETEAFRRFGGDVSAAAVEQEAWSTGIAKAGEELTEQQKILARHQLFMEQTEKTAGDFANTSDGLANSTRILSARFEDFQAQIGNVFIPVMTTALGQLNDFLTAADSDVDLGWSQRLSLAFQTILGESEESRQAYIDLKVAENEAAEAAENFTGEMHKGRGAQRRVREETDETTEAIDDQVGAFDRDERAIDRTVRQLGAYEDAQRRLTDPVFKAINDLQNLKQAQDDYNAAVEEFGSKSPEAIDAGFDLAEAQLAVDESSQNLPENLGAAADIIGLTGERAGIAATTLGLMDEAMRLLDGRRVDIELAIRQTGAPINPNTILGAEFGTRQHGGPVMARQPYIVGEAGPELFVPYTAGSVISNASLQNAGRAGSGGTTTHIHIGTVYGYDDFIRKVNQANVDGRRLGIAN